MSKRTSASLKNNAISRTFFEAKIGRSYDNTGIKFLSPSMTNPSMPLQFHAKKYLSTIPISLTDKSMNNLNTYFTECSFDLKHIQDYPGLYKIGLDICDENCDYEDLEFKCNCNTKHIEYYNDSTLSIIESVECWIYNNLTRPTTDKIKSLMTLSYSA
ncbi:9958_t:CDS:2 [Diversispora eburnea]|uniref:9958_t:CDS:1 n=1 Tax=Diversispora eburnea TaxID=1213867 RepID=A0A9N9CB18_9GLOM|nr:9958_t:CDS:2 [Diversispora eburnea]